MVRQSNLSVGDRRRVREASRELAEIWPGPDFLPRVTHTVAGVFGSGHGACAYTRTPGGDLGDVGHNLRPPFADWSTWAGAAAIPTHSLYPLAGRGRWADAPVLDGDLFAGRAERLEAFRGDVLAPNGLHHQLRVALYDGEDFVGFFGVYRPPDDRPFGPPEQAKLAALAERLRRIFSVTGLFHCTGFRESGVLAVLDALDRPAFLTKLNGAIIHANPPARMLPPALRPLVEAVASERIDEYLAVRADTVRVDGVPLRFVQWRGPASVHPGVETLPPSLRRVGELMARGLTDKEIANTLDLPLSTARTFAHRVLVRLGLHDRRQLMMVSAPA